MFDLEQDDLGVSRGPLVGPNLAKSDFLAKHGLSAVQSSEKSTVIRIRTHGRLLWVAEKYA